MNKDLDLMIETCERLCNTLSVMADNEKKFGWDLCYRIEQLSFEMYKNAEELREINSFASYDSIMTHGGLA
jgi:hypothetical protein